MKSNPTPEAVGSEVGHIRLNKNLTIYSESEFTCSLKSKDDAIISEKKF